MALSPGDSNEPKHKKLEFLKFPLYAKASFILVGIYVLISILSIAQDIILPIIYAIILSILISPAVNFLTKHKWNEVLSIFLVIFILMLIFGVLFVLLFSQIGRISDAMPQLLEKMDDIFDVMLKSLSKHLKVEIETIEDWFVSLKGEASNNSGEVIGSTITGVGGFLSTIFLTPVYIFMMLLYKQHLLVFIHKLFINSEKVSDILDNTKKIVQSYLLGLLMEFGILAVLNSLGLLLLGIDYAIILGIIGALLNIIPYLGGLIGVLLFMLVAMLTKEPVYVLHVATLYIIIQFIDNNYIVPRIVGSKVKLNALFSLLAVILGAALWGIPGMFLSIPITAVIKLILDRFEPVKHWGALLGETYTLENIPKTKNPKK